MFSFITIEAENQISKPRGSPIMAAAATHYQRWSRTATLISFSTEQTQKQH